MGARWLRRLLHGIGLIAVFLFAVFPFYWMVSSSFKTQTDILASPPLWLFHPTLANYGQVFADEKVTRAVLSSLIVAIGSTGLSVALAAPAAYALARYEFRGKADLWFWFISNRFISPIVLALPVYIIARGLGILDTHLVLILIYITFILPIVVWITTDYFRSIPKELEEAARIDGASHFQAMWRIVLPLCTPGFISAGIFAFTLAQNEFLYALIFLTKTDVRTVPVGAIAELIRGDVFYWGQLMAAALLGSVPVAIIYSFFVEHYVAGLTAGSVKG